MTDTHPCHVCEKATDDACLVCELPTCAKHFHDQVYLGVCETCWDRIQSDGRPLMQWPYPVRKIDPEWLEPDAPPVHIVMEGDDIDRSDGS